MINVEFNLEYEYGLSDAGRKLLKQAIAIDYNELNIFDPKDPLNRPSNEFRLEDLFEDEDKDSVAQETTLEKTVKLKVIFGLSAMTLSLSHEQEESVTLNTVFSDARNYMFLMGIDLLSKPVSEEESIDMARRSIHNEIASHVHDALEKMNITGDRKDSTSPYYFARDLITHWFFALGEYSQNTALSEAKRERVSMFRNYKF